MKAIVQTVLIAGGIIGLFIGVPISFFVWKMRGALSPDEHGYLVMTCVGLPALCIGAVVAGLIWRKQDKLTAGGSFELERKV
jgi:ethanolamine transporter EutH